MANKWGELSIAEAPIEIIDGDRGINYPKQDDFSQTGFCLFLNAGNVTNTGFNLSDCSFISEDKDAALRKGKAQRDDVVLTTRGTVGNVALYDASIPYDHMRINSGMVLLRADKSNLLPKYLYQFVRSSVFKERAAALTTGSAQPQLPIRDIKRIELPLPPIEEQRAIAAILGTLDDKIELNRKQNETLEAMARALFKAWFVDFEPVRAKMEGRWQRGQSLPGLPAHLYDLFPDRLVESELGEIPEGWQIRPVGDFAELKGGKQLEKEHVADAGPVPVFGGAGVMGYTTKHNADGFVISVGRVGAYCGQFFSYRGRAWINNNASLIRPYSSVPGEWLLVALRHIDMDVIKKGAAQPFVSNGDLAKVELVWPGDDIIREFANALIPLIKKTEANEYDARSLAKLRDTLLPKLISGELRVHDAERILGA